jgi:hypothetical protein
MKKVRVTYYGVEGEGRNVTEARRDAGRKIEAAMTGSYEPIVVAWRDHVILVTREPGGWSTPIIVDEEGPRDGRIYSPPDCKSEKEAIIEAQAHIAKLGWKPEDGAEPPPFLTDKAARADHRTWVEFQMRYREAKANGMDSENAHSYACRNPARPDLWKEVVKALHG